MILRLVALCTFVVALVALPGDASAEPVTIALTSAIMASGFAGTAAAAVTAAEFIVSTAFTIALTAGLSAITQRGAHPNSGINAPGVKGAVKQASAAQRIVFGCVRTSGVIYLYEVKPPNLYLGLIHSSMPLRELGNGIEAKIEANSVPLFPSALGSTILTPVHINPYAQHLRVAFQAGTLTQPVNPLIASAFPELGADFRLPGLANSAWEFDYGADFEEFQSLWGQVQIPNPMIETPSGAPIYDPRRPLQRWPDDWRDAADVDDAFSTWEPTRNAALIQAFWRAAPFGLNAGFDGTDWDRVARAADWDDKPIGLKEGGFIPRGTIDGVVQLDQRPNDVMEGMLTANRGFQVRRAGKGWIEPTRPEDPIFTITDAMIVGAANFRVDKPKRDRRTVGRSLFTSAERQHTEVHAPFYRRDDLIAEDGEELEVTIRLPFTTAHQNAQRLTKEIIEQTLLDRSLTLACSMAAFGVREGTVVRVDSRKYRHWNGIYQCEEWSLSDDRTTVGFALTEFDKSIPVAWNPSTDEKEFADLGEAA